MDASEIYSKRLNAKEVIIHQKGEFIFPIADGRIKTPGEDQELRTSTLIRPRPIRGESNIDFLGESEGSLPQHETILFEENFLKDSCGPGWDWRGNSLHPGQIIHDQITGNQWEGTPSWRRSEWKIPFRERTEIARNVFHRPGCFARQARKESMWRLVAHPMRSNQKLRVSWNPVNPQDCRWKNLYRIIMKTILQEKEKIHYSTTIWFTNFCPMPQAMKIPAAKAAVDWKRFPRGT